MKIREYTEIDKAPLLHVFQTLVPKYFAKEEILDYIAYLEKEIDQYFVAEDNGNLLGACGINRTFSEKKGVISWLFVDPKAQRKQVGRLLVKHCLQVLQADNSIEVIKVRTSQFAEAFFSVIGFKLKNIEDNYWAEGIHLYMMEYDQH